MKQKTIREQLLDIKELLELGLLTQTEYESTRSNILGLNNECVELPEVKNHEDQQSPEVFEANDKIRHRTKRLFWGGIVLAVGIIGGIFYLCQETIVDRVAEYEKAGLAVLNIEQSGSSPYAIIMDRDSLFYDNIISVCSLLPVGKQINTQEIRLFCDNDGIKTILEECDQNLAIIHSQSYNVIRLSATSFLLTKAPLYFDPMTTPDKGIDSCYLLIVNEESRDSNNKVFMIPKSKTDGQGNLCWSELGNILDYYEADFKSSFSKQEFNTIVDRRYGQYSAAIRLSLNQGDAIVINPIRFDNLKKEYSLKEVGSSAHRESMKDEIRKILREEMIESILQSASQVTGVSDRNKMRISPDDRYTFVIKDNNYWKSEKDNKALIRVDNKTHKPILIDSAMEVEFRDDCIHVKKYESVLIFFDSYKSIYYNYSGTRL